MSKRIHTSQGSRIQNGAIFDWMMDKMAADLSKGTLTTRFKNTDVSRHALVLMWRVMHKRGYPGYDKIPQAALDMLKSRVEDLDL